MTASVKSVPPNHVTQVGLCEAGVRVATLTDGNFKMNATLLNRTDTCSFADRVILIDEVRRTSAENSSFTLRRCLNLSRINRSSSPLIPKTFMWRSRGGQSQLCRTLQSLVKSPDTKGSEEEMAKLISPA